MAKCAGVWVVSIPPADAAHAVAAVEGAITRGALLGHSVSQHQSAGPTKQFMDVCLSTPEVDLDSVKASLDVMREVGRVTAPAAFVLLSSERPTVYTSSGPGDIKCLDTEAVRKARAPVGASPMADIGPAVPAGYEFSPALDPQRDVPNAYVESSGLAALAAVGLMSSPALKAAAAQANIPPSPAVLNPQLPPAVPPPLPGSHSMAPAMNTAGVKSLARAPITNHHHHHTTIPTMTTTTTHIRKNDDDVIKPLLAAAAAAAAPLVASSKPAKPAKSKPSRASPPSTAPSPTATDPAGRASSGRPPNSELFADPVVPLRRNSRKRRPPPPLEYATLGASDPSKPEAPPRPCGCGSRGPHKASCGLRHAKRGLKAARKARPSPLSTPPAYASPAAAASPAGMGDDATQSPSAAAGGGTSAVDPVTGLRKCGCKARGRHRRTCPSHIPVSRMEFVPASDGEPDQLDPAAAAVAGGAAAGAAAAAAAANDDIDDDDDAAATKQIYTVALAKPSSNVPPTAATADPSDDDGQANGNAGTGLPPRPDGKARGRASNAAAGVTAAAADPTAAAGTVPAGRKGVKRRRRKKADHELMMDSPIFEQDCFEYMDNVLSPQVGAEENDGGGLPEAALGPAALPYGAAASFAPTPASASPSGSGAGIGGGVFQQERAAAAAAAGAPSSKPPTGRSLSGKARPPALQPLTTGPSTSDPPSSGASAAGGAAAAGSSQLITPPVSASPNGSNPFPRLSPTPSPTSDLMMSSVLAPPAGTSNWTSDITPPAPPTHTAADAENLFA